MTEVKHTPGPWHWAEDHPLNACASVCARHVEVCTLFGGDTDIQSPKQGEPWPDHPIRRANARLIAAAPDMLESLRRCVDDLERALRDGYEGVWLEGDFADHLAPYRAAIAKAEGRT